MRQQGAHRLGCVDATASPAEKVVKVWIAGGSGPSTVMPGRFISSLSC